MNSDNANAPNATGNTICRPFCKGVTYPLPFLHSIFLRDGNLKKTNPGFTCPESVGSLPTKTPSRQATDLNFPTQQFSLHISAPHVKVEDLVINQYDAGGFVLIFIN